MINEHIDKLTVGWLERIEYAVKIGDNIEKRSNIRWFKALIDQLEEEATTSLAYRSGGGNPNKSSSRPPINVQYSEMVDTIHEQAQLAYDLVERDGHDPSWPLRTLLHELKHSVQRNEGSQHANSATRMVSHWVYQARIALGYESRIVRLTDTVCGQCGGTLAVAADASTEVRCIGTFGALPCGTTYPQESWADLLTDTG
ncbi:hypothetical protein [Streptomyces sp. NPDC055085]